MDEGFASVGAQCLFELSPSFIHAKFVAGEGFEGFTYKDFLVTLMVCGRT